MPGTARPACSGRAGLSHGFRPFFLVAGLFAVLIVPLRMAVWSGQLALDEPFAPVGRHIHEMLFG